MKIIIRQFILCFFVLKIFTLFSQTIAVVGDFENTPVRVDSVTMLVASWNPDMVITTGDNFDSLNGPIDSLVGKYYSDFIYPYHGVFGPGGITNKFYPSIGNHDLVSNGLVSYLNYFTLPGNERYYKIETGNIAFFILNSNASESDGVTDTSVQGQWLRSQLALSANTWKIIVFHHPPYTSGTHPSTTYMQWPFNSWGADAVISGHNHMYERLYSNNVSYFVNGMGGAALYTYGSVIPESQFIYNKCWGAMKIEPFSDSIVFRFYTIRDSLVDKYVIYKFMSGASDISEVHANVLQNNLTITFNGLLQEPVGIEIYDTPGKLISGYNSIIPENNKCSVNIATMKNGIYFVRVFNKKFISTKKFAVMY